MLQYFRLNKCEVLVMIRLLQWLVTWQGRVARKQYLLAGTLLTILKYSVDRSVAARFGETWHVWNYVLPLRDFSIFGLGSQRPTMYALLWAVAIPFFWCGIALTLRRLRDAGHQPGWVILFFVPVANLCLFLWLSVAPTRTSVHLPGTEDSSAVPARKHTVLMGMLLAVMLGVALVALSTNTFHLYGWGLFLGAPFMVGFIASWALNAAACRSVRQTVLVSIVAVLLVGLALIGFRYEGLICLLMAFPLCTPFAIAGALVARCILGGSPSETSPPKFAAYVAIFPFLIFAEHAAKLEPPVIAVTTSVTVDAPASVVWKNVISFPPLAPPTELAFRTGIAYPTSGAIVGKGAGAVRYCHFSTGDFVEPITAWDEDHLLAFNVASQPQSMRELSPWDITPPHLEYSYMRSRHGQFRLTSVGRNKTLLEGTTWYQNYLWPQPYWKLWSQNILHTIHRRVLQHVKQQAELAASTQAD
jgi:uncharacterized membrane protein YhaH (DUF805 family)